MDLLHFRLNPRQGERKTAKERKTDKKENQIEK